MDYGIVYLLTNPVVAFPISVIFHYLEQSEIRTRPGI